jgi:tRNA_anti-like
MKKKILKWGLIIVIGGLLIGGGITLYMFNQPHRDVQATTADYKMNANQLVNEYLANAEASNEKYLDEEGESKIIEVTGTISEISVDLNNNTVILLKTNGDKAGVSCTLLKTTDSGNINLGDVVTIKGVIRAGAGYDEDLELYEDVIMEKAKIIKQ